MRRSGRPKVLFATGWLSLAGYIAIASLMVESIGLRTANHLQLFVGLDVPLILLVPPITLIAGLSEVIAPNEQPKIRNTVRWLLIAAVLGYMGWVLAVPPPVTEGIELEHLKARHWLSAVAIPAAGLWMVELLLDHRPQFRRSDHKLGLVIVFGWVLCGAVGSVAAYLFLKHPDLRSRAEGIVEIVWERDVLKLAASVFAYAISIITLVKCLTRGTRLAGAMAVDGLLPETFEQKEAHGRLPSSVLVALSVIVSLLGAYLEFRWLVGVAAVSFLWVALIAIGLGVRRNQAPRKKALRLPFHPLFPLLALGTCAFFSLIVPQPAALLTGGWLVFAVPWGADERVVSGDSVRRRIASPVAVLEDMDAETLRHLGYL